jgi:hypothetical protein
MLSAEPDFSRSFCGDSRNLCDRVECGCEGSLSTLLLSGVCAESSLDSSESAACVTEAILIFEKPASFVEEVLNGAQRVIIYLDEN